MAAFSGLHCLSRRLCRCRKRPRNPRGFPFVRTLLLIVYGIPFLIGVWWLLLFNQRAIKSSFSRGSGRRPTRRSGKAACPLPLAILAGFSILSAGFSLLLPFTNFPVNVILFGHRFHGAIGVALFYFLRVSC